jgi:hypothetical protein
MKVPRDGSLTLADIRPPSLSIVCEPCGRHGRYNVAKLIAEHGDTKLTHLLVTLANCQKARSASIHDRCKGEVPGLQLPSLRLPGPRRELWRRDPAAGRDRGARMSLQAIAAELAAGGHAAASGKPFSTSVVTRMTVGKAASGPRG